MLFGPKRDGFAEEVVITEFSNDVREPRKDKTAPPKIVYHEEKQPDLLDYLPLPPNVVELPNHAGSESEVFPPGEKKVQLLADFIRERSRGAKLTGKSLLLEEEEELEELLISLKEDEAYADIVSLKGDKDEYFYSNLYMSDNYAMIAVLVEEKNLPKTIAEMVRWNAKTYPTPTPVRYFMSSPYFYTEPQINRALDLIKQMEEYRDIKEVTTGNNVKYLYSTWHMSERYAKALAEQAEYGEFGY